MKKTIFYSTIIALSFLIACNDSAQKTEESTQTKTENSGSTVNDPAPNNVPTQTTPDTSKRTSVSVGPNGAGVKHKNTQINVDKNGINVGTKDVKVDIKK